MGNKIMPVSSFNPDPMKLGLFTDSLAELPFEQMLDEASRMGIEVLEFGTGGYSITPHLDMQDLLQHEESRKVFMDAILSRGLEIAALNCSANAMWPGGKGEQHAKDIMDTFKLAELLGVKHIVSQSGLPAGCPEDKCLNWVTHTYPPEMSEMMKYQWDEVIGFWKKAAKEAENHGVETIALENHPMNVVCNTTTLLLLREAVGPIIGMNLDPSHMFFMGGDPIMIARYLTERKAIYHVHGKDTRINKDIRGLDGVELRPYNAPAAGRGWNYVSVGYGHDHLWWKEFFGTLAAGDYHGPVCIEVEDPLMPDNLVAVERSAAFLRETMLIKYR